MTTKETRPRGRPRQFDTEEAIAVAQGLFHARGYDRVGVEEISMLLGIRPPSFYAAFGSKMGLYQRVLERYGSTDAIPLSQLLRPDAPVAECLAAVLEEAARRYAAHPAATGCLVLEGTHCTDEDARQAACDARTALLALATLAVYVYAYTPLKRRTHLATLVGAVPGALPIVGGWSATGAPLDVRAAALFAILFLWQLPHVLALGWMHREDYARAGLRMLSVDDAFGGATFRQAALTSAALVPVSLVPTTLAMGGRLYFVAALALPGANVVLALDGVRAPTPARARRLFLATLAYLPALLGTLVAGSVS